jgi:hypothetical protein
LRLIDLKLTAASGQNKNSTPAHPPEVLSATDAVCCDLNHGQDSNWSEPWAAATARQVAARL